MGAVIDKITEFIKEMLQGWVLDNLGTMFTDVNTKVGTIAGEVGKTPSTWNAGIFSMIENLSDTVMVPIAGMIISAILCYELITMVMDKNNMHEMGSEFFFRYLVKACIAVLLVSYTSDITMAIFDVGNHIVTSAAAVITGSTTIDVTTTLQTMFNNQLSTMGIGELIGLGIETMIVSLCMKIISLLITVMLYGRMIEIYLYVSVAPVPFATLSNREWGSIGSNYIKGVCALAFQGFFIMVCVAIYAVLVSGIAVATNLHTALWSVAAYTVVLCFSLFKTGWQLIENKQKFIGQIMTSKSPVRSCEDVDEAALTYAEVKALATGNPYIKEKMDLDIQVSKLKLMKANHTSQKYRLEDNIAKHYPQQIATLKERISGMQTDIQTAKENLPVDKEQFSMKVGDKLYTDKKEAGTALVAMCKEMKSVNAPMVIGEYAGFKMAVSFDSFNHKFVMNVKGQLSHNLEIGSDPLGNIARINHALESMPKQLAEAQTKLETVERQLETAKVEVTKPFAQEAELAEKLDRLSALNALLNMDEKGDDTLSMDEDEPEASKGEKEVADRLAKNIPMAEKAANVGLDKGVKQYADAPAGRVSLKERLAEMKVKAAGNNVKKSVEKEKDREDIL
jgi:uncharacterized membrane-anchored protein YhcB (DUF1043 family)